MCTMSLFRDQQTLIVTMNRDEARLRTEAGLKQQQLGNIQVLYPVDGLAGGTWFGLNDSGVVMALLNRYQDPQIEGAETRGAIIPLALAKGDYSDVLEHLNGSDFSRFNPFDLFVIGIDNSDHFSWNGQQVTVTKRSENALLFSSSSLNTELVLDKRQARFEQWLKQQPEQIWHAPQILQQLHLYQDPLDPSDSVLMDRLNTHSKSICQVHLQADQCRFSYYPEASLNQWRQQRSDIEQLPRQLSEFKLQKQ